MTRQIQKVIIYIDLDYFIDSSKAGLIVYQAVYSANSNSTEFMWWWAVRC